ncbi:MAG: ribonuclease E/G [Zetaproteobacteria bacterium CG_4_9_14_3_um_filter_49_83]|nr:MAG: ribonuclease E/G [Zetaproteobacteria bacterium CG17_big_fil_post_rev_8_21_14_2_50_50_13]PIY54671.1 MAG: ribonuclease E/G [Zetaproteobacteria bacterium CG_4_10_14_0_8_um_filter_49_80]PJA35721.1 MAG: ribonuclease E/G [Zetaproteobacteria bacterium CG_4_9_14_3_um_filter_49_83]
MLINASHDEESRVAIVIDEYLHELDIESGQKALTKGNIYKGVITKVEPSLQAAFVEYGAARQGFLPLNEIHPDFWKEGVDKSADTRKVNIQDALEHKQHVLVQVVKEERGTKGAALTTFISLAGRYLVLSPNTARGGISRKLSEEARRAIKQILSQLNVPENMGLIVRTAGKDQTLESLKWDYQYLSRLWDEIRIKSNNAPAPSLIYLEGDLATRAIRDHFTDDIAEIWVDNHEIYTQTKHFIHAVLPGKEKLVKLYRGKKPLFRHYKIEQQCEEIHEREIRLPSGGSIVFDPTEALTSVDVNSSRATGAKNIDETALETNLEAATEVARQLRIRDIGGLIVIDFIDMANRKHAQQVEEALRDAVKGDKARIQLARISRFGLLEMSRQRLHPSVRESTAETCPRCQGRGSIRTVESMALQMLTRMEDWAESGKKPVLFVQVPSDTGEYLMNSKRDRIARIEKNYDIQINLQIKPELDIPHYRIERQWTDENNQQRIEVLEDTSKNKRPPKTGRKLKPLKPVVGVPKPLKSQEPKQAEKKKGGLLALLKGLFVGKKQEATADESIEQPKPLKRRTPKPAPSTKRQAKPATPVQKPAKVKVKPEVEEAKPVVAETDESAAATTAEGQRRRRRRRRRPSQKPSELAEPQNSGTASASPEAQSTPGENKGPRRRKRPAPKQEHEPAALD